MALDKPQKIEANQSHNHPAQGLAIKKPDGLVLIQETPSVSLGLGVNSTEVSLDMQLRQMQCRILQWL